MTKIVKVKNFLKAKKDKVAVASHLFALMFLMNAGVAYCSEPTADSITLNFQPSEMFKWTQMILDVMLPVLYITLGISLAFIIIRALKAAFA